ncbi:MAG: pirin family protein [Pirellulales bacterium]
MLRIRRANDRGHFNHGWLDTYHTFSFGDYHDPEQMGFRVLRVINEDRVAPGQGFGMHGHRDMEIVTLVLEGELEHRDSLGSGEVLRPGELQRMTAGTVIRHSEFNPSADEQVHLYQIWLLPERAGLPPSYEQRAFGESEKDHLNLVASRDGRDGSLTIYQDARIFLATLGPGSEIRHEISDGRHAWLQVLRGDLEVNGMPLATSDAASASDEAELVIRSAPGAELMLFDLP